MSGLTAAKEWQALSAHYQQMRPTSIAQLFHDDPARFEKFSLRLDGFCLDYSKNLLTGETVGLLLELARSRGLERLRDEMFSGALVNSTEKRPALHTALRQKNPPPEVQKTLSDMRVFSDAIRSGEWRGCGGKKITDIVNIGIGGSSLGPQLVTEALTAFHLPHLRAHFVSNVEASDLGNTLKTLSPETTVVIVVSKTFTTAETLQNAEQARAWFLERAARSDLDKHFVAISGNVDAARSFGIAANNVFPMWDWVGGRYSVWSAVGLTVMLMAGAEGFRQFLSGAAAMDDHFRSAPLERNMPVLMGLIGLWYRNFCDMPALACIPYHVGLRCLPAWLQQLDMESNGKSVDKSGQIVDVPTGPIIFGEPGTDAQHSFFQWLHQSPEPVPTDLIAVVKPVCGTRKQHLMLLSNVLAQSEALMMGQKNPSEPHRNFTGNRPTNVVLLDELTPYHLGLLLALYEHKIFVQGALWNINSFDQWGVELGKVMAKRIQSELENKRMGAHDSSTTWLMKHVLAILDRDVS